MNYIIRFLKREELYHHGILGQKWGQRNGPPYPIAPSNHSASEKKKGYYKSIKGYSDTKGTVHHYSPIFAQAEDVYFKERESRVFPDGRKIYPAIGEVISDFERAGKGNPYPGPKGFDGLYDRVNPNYGEPGTTNNCPFVGAAMEIASRGYKVVARRSLGGASAGVFEKWFKGAQNEHCDTFEEMKQDILADGDGSSGVLQGFFGAGLGSGQGGHTLHWRNERGRIIVADGQCHEEMDFDEIVNRYGFNPGECIRTRLDTCEPDWERIGNDGVLGVDSTARRWVDTWNGGVYDKFGELVAKR